MPPHAPGESKLTVSTQLALVAHIDNHGVDHRGISSEQQLLVQRCLRLHFKWNLTMSPDIKKKNKKEKNHMNFLGDHCKLGPVKNSTEAHGQL